MTIEKFELGEIESNDAQEYFREHGFLFFRNTPIEKISTSFRRQLATAIRLRGDTLGIELDPDDERSFYETLLGLHTANRDAFVTVLDLAQTLPGVFGMLDNSFVAQCLSLMGYHSLSTNWPPVIRMDFPQEDVFLLPDHQDRHYNGGSENAVTCYFQLASSGQSPLGIRPGSHKYGSLPRKHLDVRPYVVLEDGEWQERCPLIELEFEENDMLFFHMDLVHRSGLNRSDRPRVTVQLRYNNLEDPEYLRDGWPATYKTLTVKDTILAEKNT